LEVYDDQKKKKLNCLRGGRNISNILKWYKLELEVNSHKTLKGSDSEPEDPDNKDVLY